MGLEEKETKQQDKVKPQDEQAIERSPPLQERKQKKLINQLVPKIKML